MAGDPSGLPYSLEAVQSPANIFKLVDKVFREIVQ